MAQKESYREWNALQKGNRNFNRKRCTLHTYRAQLASDRSLIHPSIHPPIRPSITSNLLTSKHPGTFPLPLPLTTAQPCPYFSLASLSLCGVRLNSEPPSSSSSPPSQISQFVAPPLGKFTGLGGGALGSLSTATLRRPLTVAGAGSTVTTAGVAAGLFISFELLPLLLVAVV